MTLADIDGLLDFKLVERTSESAFICFLTFMNLNILIKLSIFVFITVHLSLTDLWHESIS